MNSKLSTFAIIFIAFSAALDIFTTEFLLATGDFHEMNPLYYALGHNAFLALFIGLTVTICIIVNMYDQSQPHMSKKAFRAAIAILSGYGMLHFFLGAQQLVIMIRILLGAK